MTSGESNTLLLSEGETRRVWIHQSWDEVFDDDLRDYEALTSQAGSWRTCLVGEYRARFPHLIHFVEQPYSKTKVGYPADLFIYDLGMTFDDAIEDDNFDKAREIRDKLLDYLSKLAGV